MLTTKNVHLHHGGDVVSQRAFIVWGTFANHNTDLATQDVWHYSCMDSSHAQWRRLEKTKNKHKKASELFFLLFISKILVLFQEISWSGQLLTNTGYCNKTHFSRRVRFYSKGHHFKHVKRQRCILGQSGGILSISESKTTVYTAVKSVCVQLTSLYPWGTVPDISAKGSRQPAGQYLLRMKTRDRLQSAHFLWENTPERNPIHLMHADSVQCRAQPCMAQSRPLLQSPFRLSSSHTHWTHWRKCSHSLQLDSFPPSRAVDIFLL